MPDVGVLSLTIESNAGQAATGLGSLAKALERVQKAVGTGLDLSGVAGQLQALSAAVSGSEKTLTSIGTFVNAITNYTNAIGKLKTATINTKPIEDIKEAVKGGFGIGQAGTQINKLREALAGEWNTDNAYQAGMALSAIAEGAKSLNGVSLGTIAKNVSATAKALSEYADATEKVKAAVGENAGDSNNAYQRYAEGLQRGMDAVESGSRKGRALNLQFFARKGKQVPGQMSMDLDGTAERIKDVVSQLQVTDAVVSNIVKDTEGISERFKAFTSMESITSPISQIADSFRQAATDVRYYGSALDAVLPKVQALSSAEMIEAENSRYAAMSAREQKLLLAELQGEIPPVSAREVVPEAINADAGLKTVKIELQEIGDTVTSVVIPAFREMYQIWSMMAYELGMFQSSMTRLTAGESPLMLGSGIPAGQLLLGDGSEPQTFLKVWHDTGEQWVQDWVFFSSEAAEAMRAHFSPDWIFGGGNVPQSMSTFHLGTGEMPLLLGPGGVSQENMLSTNVDTSQQWQTDWIIGEGTVSEASDALEEYAEAIEHVSSAAADKSPVEYVNQMNEALGNSSAEASINLDAQYIDNLINSATEIDLLNMKIEALRAKAIEGMETGRMTGDQLASVVSQIQNAQAKIDELQASTTGLTGAWNGLKSGIEKLFPTLTRLMKRFKSMIIMRSMRYLIREFAKGFSEGLQNMYHYSEAIGSDFAPAMDSIATALATVKNSIGAALAPALQSIIPILQQVISWFISGINVINQFFALLNGQSTWTKAIETQTKAYDDNKKAAGGAGKAAKDLLADWDELNIIQNESGGGGGGGSSKVPTDYENMFEQVNEFTEGIKRAIKFIEDHLGGVGSLLKKLGLLILGWKFSKAFEGIVGKLGKILAGSMLVELGLELTYGAGFEAGRKGYFDGADLITTIAGTIAAGVGGSMITTALGLGSGVGFAIGITGAIVATLIGYIDGQAIARDASKWGNLTWTKDQIDAFVKSQFTFDVVAYVEVIDGHITVAKGAKTNINKQITNFGTSLKTAQINVKMNVDKDKASASIVSAAADAQEAITAIQELITASNAGLTFTLKEFKYTNDKGEDITDDILSSINIADTTLASYFTGLGEDIAALILAGERSGWANGEAEQALALMESQKRIFDRAAEIEADLKRNSDIKTSMNGIVKNGIIDQETAKGVIARQEEILNNVKEKTLEQQRVLSDNYFYLASLATAAAEEAGLDTEQGKALLDAADTYTQQALRAIDEIDEKIEAKLAETKANMAREWAETFKTVYGADFEDLIKEGTKPQMLWLGRLVDSTFNESLRHASEQGTAGEFLRNWIEAEFGRNDPTGTVTSAIANLGLNVWDLLSDDLRKTLYSNTASVLGDNDKATEALMSAFGLSKEGIEPYITEYQGELNKEVESQKPEIDVPTQVNIEPEVDPESLGVIPDFLKTIGLGFLVYNPPEVEVPVEVKPVIDGDNLKNELKEQIRYAMTDGRIFEHEKQFMIKNYGGEEMYNNTLAELMQEWTPKSNADLLEKPDETLGNSNIEMPEVESTAYENSLKDVEDTTQETVDDINAIFEELVGYLQKEGVTGLGMFEQVNAMLQGGDIEGLKEMLNMYRELYGVINGAEEGTNVGKINDWVLRRGGLVTGGMGVTDIDLRRGSMVKPTPVNQQEAEPIDYSKMANSVQQGTANANNSVVSELQTMVGQLSRLLAKQWTVNVTTLNGRVVG